MCASPDKYLEKKFTKENYYSHGKPMRIYNLTWRNFSFSVTEDLFQRILHQMHLKLKSYKRKIYLFSVRKYCIKSEWSNWCRILTNTFSSGDSFWKYIHPLRFYDIYCDMLYIYRKQRFFGFKSTCYTNKDNQISLRYAL